MEQKRISPLKAIRLKCLDCCCGSSNEVKLCTVERCALHPFREGHNPNISKREYTDAERSAIGARLLKSRIADKMEKSANATSEG